MIVGLQVASGVLALVWAVLLFAIIDLLTALTWRAGWEETLALEASWGALFTFFMVVPLLVVMVRPVRYVEAGLWSVVVAASLLTGSIIATDATVVWLAVVALVTGGIVVGLGLAAARRSRLPRPTRPRIRPPWLLAALAAVGLPLWSIYVAHTVGPHAGVPPSVTIAFDHWPVQAALGVAVPIAAIIAAIVVEWRGIAVTAAALSAAVVGVTAALSQGLPVGTESPTWCIAAVLWGTLLALALRVAHEEGPPEGGPSTVDRR